MHLELSIIKLYNILVQLVPLETLCNGKWNVDFYKLIKSRKSKIQPPIGLNLQLKPSKNPFKAFSFGRLQDPNRKLWRRYFCPEDVYDKSRPLTESFPKGELFSHQVRTSTENVGNIEYSLLKWHENNSGRKHLKYICQSETQLLGNFYRWKVSRVILRQDTGALCEKTSINNDVWWLFSTDGNDTLVSFRICATLPVNGAAHRRSVADQKEQNQAQRRVAMASGEKADVVLLIYFGLWCLNADLLSCSMVRLDWQQWEDQNYSAAEWRPASF